MDTTSSSTASNQALRSNTLDEMIEIIKAHQQGKKIEVRGKHENWSELKVDLHKFSPQFGWYQYRVKREPVVAWVVFNCVGGFCCYAANKEMGERMVAKRDSIGSLGPYRLVKMVEEIES